MQNAFSVAELIGRAKALKMLDTIAFTDDENYTIIPTDRNCRWDFEVVDNATKRLLAIIEVKDRQMTSTDSRIVGEGCHLDSGKYNALQRMGRKRHIDAYYLATFKDNVGIVWDVMNAPTDITEKWSNKTTAEESYKVLKEFHLFHKESACFVGRF